MFAVITRIGISAAAIIGLTWWLSAGQASDIPVEHMREVLLTVEVRKALLDDPELGPLNLGVKVIGRVATLWGPVPSAALKRRAEQVLKNFPYISEVRNDLHVQTLDIPMVMPSQIGRERWIKSTPPATPQPEAKTAPPTTVDTRRSEADGRSAYTALSPMADLPTPASPVDLDSPEVLQQKIAELQKTNPRYQGIRIRVRLRDVFLTADPARSPAMYEMAQTIARLPGVANVVVHED